MASANDPPQGNPPRSGGSYRKNLVRKMSGPRRSFVVPRTIRRIAARRVFKGPSGKPVVLTLGVPQAVRDSTWGCPLQITGLKDATFRRPKYIYGIDGLQALHLAMKCADAVLVSSKLKLEWLGQVGDLGMPKFLPWLPKP